MDMETILTIIILPIISTSFVTEMASALFSMETMGTNIIGIILKGIALKTKLQKKWIVNLPMKQVYFNFSSTCIKK